MESDHYYLGFDSDQFQDNTHHFTKEPLMTVTFAPFTPYVHRVLVEQCSLPNCQGYWVDQMDAQDALEELASWIDQRGIFDYSGPEPHTRPAPLTDLTPRVRSRLVQFIAANYDCHLKADFGPCTIPASRWGLLTFVRTSPKHWVITTSPSRMSFRLVETPSSAHPRRQFSKELAPCQANHTSPTS